MPPSECDVPMFGDEGQEVLPGVGGAEFFLCGGGGEFRCAAVDEDGLASGCGDPELGDEGGVLDVRQRIVDVVVVEADFADGDAARVRREGRQLG